MELNQQLVRQGSRLFRWRSLLPLALLPLMLVAMRDGEYIRAHFGDAVDTAWESICIAVAFAGLALRMLTVGFVPAGTSGRNTLFQKADALNRTGMYSIVRHPIYLANYVIFLAILMFVQSLWLVLAGTLAYWIYYERIILAEEDFLSRQFGTGYSVWAALTPSVIPRPSLWKKPELPFSLRAAIAREYTTLYAVVLTLTAMDLLDAFIDGDPVVMDNDWLVFFWTGTVLYLGLRFIKKNTCWLHVEGR